MAFTELLPVASIQGSASATRTIAAGAVVRVGLKANGPIDSTMAGEIQVGDDALGWQKYRELQGGINISELLQGPVTYRVVRVRGTLGAYEEA